MEEEHIDPVYNYIDDKIKLTKRELQRLKVAHDAVAAQQKQALLSTQRTISAFIVVSTFSMFSTNLPKKSKTQLASLASAARAKIDTSDNPLSVATQYYSECLNLSEDSGIETIRFG